MATYGHVTTLSKHHALERFRIWQPGGLACLLGAAAPRLRQGDGVAGLAGVGQARRDLDVERRADVHVVVGRVAAEKPGFGDDMWRQPLVGDLFGEVERVTGIGIGGV
jgi:hypothetical protein